MFLVTSGAIVTVVVDLTRTSFAEHLEKDNDASGDSGYAGRDLCEVNAKEEEIEEEDSKPKSTWQRKVKKGKGAKKPVKKQLPSKKKQEAEAKKKAEEERLAKEASEQKKVKKIKEKADEEEDSDSEPNHVEDIEED